MKEYGLSKDKAEQMTEYDYCIMVAFKNLGGKQEEYLMENNK
jgi:hypothetical protein